MTFLDLCKTLLSLLILLTILRIVPAFKTALASFEFKKKYIKAKEFTKEGADDGRND